MFLSWQIGCFISRSDNAGNTDNAGCYHCAPLWLTIPGLGERTGKLCTLSNCLVFIIILFLWLQGEQVKLVALLKDIWQALLWCKNCSHANQDENLCCNWPWHFGHENSNWRWKKVPHVTFRFNLEYIEYVKNMTFLYIESSIFKNDTVEHTGIFFITFLEFGIFMFYNTIINKYLCVQKSSYCCHLKNLKKKNNRAYNRRIFILTKV